MSCNVQFVPIDFYPLYVLNVLSRARHAEECVCLGDALKCRILVPENIPRLDVSFMQGYEMSPRTELGRNG